MAIVAALTSFDFFQNHSFGTSNSFWRPTNNKVFLHCISRSRSIDFTMCSCEGINILYSFSTFSYDQAAFIGRNGDIFCVFRSIFISSSKRSGTEDSNFNGGLKKLIFGYYFILVFWAHIAFYNISYDPLSYKWET